MEDELIINLIGSDFKGGVEKYGNIDLFYCIPNDCPLARAVKRIYQSNDILIGGDSADVLGVEYIMDEGYSPVKAAEDHRKATECNFNLTVIRTINLIKHSKYKK